MCCGERRRDWQRPPSLSEMADMKLWASKVLGGFPSLLTARDTGEGFALLRRTEANARTTAHFLAEHLAGTKITYPDPAAPAPVQEVAPRQLMPAPYGMAKDDPLRGVVYELWRE